MAKSFDDLVAERINYRRADEFAARKIAEERYASEKLELPDLTLTEFVEETDEEVEWRIAGLHAIGHNTTLTAAYKSGKSTMMINLLRSLADGASFLGQTVVKPAGRTAYWNLEVAQGQMRDWCRKVGIADGSRVVVSNLRGQRTNIWSDDACATIVEWLSRNEIECWIIDPGARLLPGWPGSGNPENDNGVIGDLTDRLDRIKLEAKVQDLWIPLHTGRQGTQARGAARWDDWTDAIWKLWVKEEGGVDERHFSGLGRDVDFPEVVLGYDAATHREWCIGTAEQAKQNADARTVVMALRNGPLATKALEQAMTGLKGDRKGAAQQDALARGWVSTHKDGRAVIWTLNESHPDVIEQAMSTMEVVK